MSLQVITEQKDHRQLGMTIEVEQERVDSELRKAARRVAQQIRIPGFRKGRAPYHIIVQNVGVGALFEEFVDDLGQELYQQALEQEEIEPYATATLDDIEMEPLRYKLTVPLQPEIKLGDYHALRVEEPDIQVDEELVQERIDQLLQRHAGYRETDNPSQYGDLLTIDVRAVVLDEEGNETDTFVLDEEDWDITPDDENPMEPAGFDEELIGLKPGDEKTFDIAWPEDSPSMYSGKDVRFSVKVHEIQAYQQPELTDELAQTIGPDYETADDLIEDIRDSLEEEVEQEHETEYLDNVLDSLVDISEIDYPPAAVDLQLDQMLRNTEMQLQQMGLQGMDQYLQMIGQSEEEYRDSMREQAEAYLRRNLVLAELAEAENLQVTEEEFEERLNEMFGDEDVDASDEDRESRQGVMDMMHEQPNRQVVEDQIINEKAIERILAIARGEEIDRPADADEADDDGEEILEDAPDTEQAGEEVATETESEA